MPIIDAQDARDLDSHLQLFFDSDPAERPHRLRLLFTEKFDFNAATGKVSLADAPKNVTLPSNAERIASIEGINVVYVPLELPDTTRVRKAEAAASARMLARQLGDDMLLLISNQQTGGEVSQLHVILPTFAGSTLALCRMIIERDLPRRTVLQQLSNIYHQWQQKKDLRLALEEAFDVEAVTKRFFEQYHEVFKRVQRLVKGFPETDDGREAKKLFVQTLFNRLMFIYFLSRKGWLKFEGDPDYLAALWKDYKKKKDAKNFYRERLRLLFFSGLNNPRSVDLAKDDPPLYALIGDVPFLNGGLFTEEDQDKRSDISILDEAFSPIFHDLFEHYNFTVTESTPLDQEVAVDPEMLGKVFEELVTGRHESGSYYTPRPVVSFMCQEALKGYLQGTVVTLPTEAIERFVDQHDVSELNLASAEKVRKALEQIKVVDPACGSGAYLLGMMHELVELETALYSEKLLMDSKSLYDLKLRIIEENVYGVDIDQFAVNVAMLRLWLSLAIDYESYPPPPLPNLDFKIVCGDSLIAPDPNPNNYGTLFRHRVREIASQIADLKARHLKATSQEKDNLFSEIESSQGELRKVLSDEAAPEEAVDWRVEFAEVFDQNDGFDIVLTNPPYVSAMEFRRTRPRAERALLNAMYKAAQGAYDYYILFFERSMQLLQPQGLLSFITPNKYLSAPYARALRELLHSETTFLGLVDLSCVPVFRRTQVYPVLSLFQLGNSPDTQITLLHPNSYDLKDFDPLEYSRSNAPSELLNALPDHIWGFLLANEFDLLLKLIGSSVPLSSLADVRATTTAAEADEYSSEIVDMKPRSGFKVVNTGTIDPFVSLWGSRRLRDGGRQFLTPYLPSSTASLGRRELYGKRKIIVAKIAKSCEAMLDDLGEYAGLNVNCVFNPCFSITLEYVLAYLHSTVFRFIYSQYFGALRMAGGDLQFQAPQLRIIPMRVPEDHLRTNVTQNVRRIRELLMDGEPLDSPEVKRLTEQVDENITSSYGLTNGETLKLSKLRI